MRFLAIAFLFIAACWPLSAQEGCMTIHGRANLYGGDLQLRIWHIGTHHEYEPDESTWATVIEWLNAGVKRSERQKYAIPASSVLLYADFLICPTEPFKQGSVQSAKIKSATHRRYVHID